MSTAARPVLAATGDPVLDARVQTTPGWQALVPGCETVSDCLEHLALSGAAAAVLSPALGWAEPGGLEQALPLMKARHPAADFYVWVADVGPAHSKATDWVTLGAVGLWPSGSGSGVGAELAPEVSGVEPEVSAEVPPGASAVADAATVPALTVTDETLTANDPTPTADEPTPTGGDPPPMLPCPPVETAESAPAPPDPSPRSESDPLLAVTPGWELLRGRWETHFGGAHGKPAATRPSFAFPTPRRTPPNPPLLPGVPPAPPAPPASAPVRSLLRSAGNVAAVARPVRTEILRQRTVAVWGGKAGSGRSTLTVALADLISQIAGISVCTWDLNADNSSLAVLVGKENEPSSWSLLSESAPADLSAKKIKEAALTIKPNWDLITGPGGHKEWRELLDPYRAGRILDAIRSGYDCVLLDTPVGAGPVARWALGTAQIVVILVSAFFPDVIDTARTYERLVGEGVLIPDRCRLVLGQWIDSPELPSADVSACFDLPVAAQIPMCPSVTMLAARTGRPIPQLGGPEVTPVVAALAQVAGLVVEPAGAAAGRSAQAGLLGWLRP